MTIAEKIQFYRKANKLTQKQLAENSGLSEISIRKYEAGDRFPKNEQLQKLVAALPIGGSNLLDIKPESIPLDTVGDAMALIYLLKEKLGVTYAVDQLPNGAIDPASICIHFNNDKINECLERIITEEVMAEQLKANLANSDDEVSKTQLLADQFLLEQTKEEMVNDKTLLD